MSEDGKASTIVDRPFIVVDAAIGAALEYMVDEVNRRQTMRWSWRPLTSGSSRHTMALQGRPLFLVSVYAIEHDRTEVVVDVVAGPEGPERKASALLFLRNLVAMDQIAGDAAATDALQDFLLRTHPPQASRQDPDNRAAREALARGEDRKAVFLKWAEQKKYNITDEAQRKRADAAFRQMLTNKPRS